MLQQRRYSQDFVNEAHRFLFYTDLYEETQIVILRSFNETFNVYFSQYIVLPASKYIVSLVGFHTNGSERNMQQNVLWECVKVQ